MSLENKSIDEITVDLADAFDSYVQQITGRPLRIYRNHNNKLYLLLQAYAAGKAGINALALALKNRFNPLLCDESDLYSLAKLVGTDVKEGSGSIVDITIRNKDEEEQKILKAGTYYYQAVSGTIFSFAYPNDYAFDPLETKVVSAISQEKGAYPVAQNAKIKVFRPDGEKIDGALLFSCADNARRLGYPDESLNEFRRRILTDAERHDHLKELEVKIRNLPNVFECNLVLNEGIDPVEYDGVTLEAKELLVTITGVPTDALAELVAGQVLYATHAVDPAQVVFYYNSLLAGGKYPVYYRFHETMEFSLDIAYQFDLTKLKAEQVEYTIDQLFSEYTRMVTHIDVFTEQDAYSILTPLNLPNVKILYVNIRDASGEPVPYVQIPLTRIPHLTGIAYTGTNIGATE
jgi:hypothetical protein